MASTPSFAATSRWAAALVGARDTTALPTGITAPSNVSTVLTGGASGTKIEEVVLTAANTTAAGVFNIYIYDATGGTAYRLFDQILITAVTASNAAVSFRARRQYQNLLLPSASYSLRVNHSAATTTNDNILLVTAFGADF